ncbi:hypothetical protein N9272_00645 [bacterium]|nr:hypothetical protein [bacterium]
MVGQINMWRGWNLRCLKPEFQRAMGKRIFGLNPVGLNFFSSKEK